MNNTQDACMNLSQFERNKYFYGKLMTVRDFETEQSYFNEKGHLLSRLIHGTGLVCGLEVEEPTVDTAGTLTLKLSPGVAIDCCGREIVVGEEFNGKELEAQGMVSGTNNYIYLKYEECEKEPVPVPVNASTCEETCCYNRTKESFGVVVSQNPPEIPEVPPGVLTDTGGELEKKKIAHDYYNRRLTVCPSCAELEARVLLAVITVNDYGTLEVDETETLRYRALVYNNPMLYELISSHLIDTNNPHNVTAEQVRALKSVNGVGNVNDEYVENIDLESDDGTIRINPTPDDEKIDLILNENSVRIEHIETMLRGQLDTVFQYLRERALKCTVINFREVQHRFEGDAAVESAAKEVSDTFKDLVEAGAYESNEDFVEAMKSNFVLEQRVADELRKRLEEEKTTEGTYVIVTEDSLIDFETSLGILETELNLGDPDPLKVATAQDEVCFYALLLDSERIVCQVVSS